MTDTSLQLPPQALLFLHSEPLALDLVNTRMQLPAGQVDLFDHRAHRAVWLGAEAARLQITSRESTRFTAPVVDALAVVRDHATVAIEAARSGRRPAGDALAGLNRAVQAAPAVPQARWETGVVVTTATRTGPFRLRLAASFAEAALQLLGAPEIGRVRRCEAEPCSMLFLPNNLRRRWCVPSICGNRERVARYYRRHRGAPDPVTRGRLGARGG